MAHEKFRTGNFHLFRSVCGQTMGSLSESQLFHKKVSREMPRVLVVSSGGYETSAIHSKIHSKKIKYAVQSKAILPTIATSKLEQIWKADVVLYPENL